MRHETRGDAPLPHATSAPARPAVVGVTPSVDGGRRALKAIVGVAQDFVVDVITDGHDLLTCELRHRHEDERRWSRVPLVPLGNDAYGATLVFNRLGRHEVVVHAAVDHFASWRHDIVIKAAAGEDIGLELIEGGNLARHCAMRARGSDRRALVALTDPFVTRAAELTELDDDELATLCSRYPDPAQTVTTALYPVQVERERARHGNWYELFPRSTSPDPERPGTLRDVIDRLDYLEGLAVDVLYLPPIHPIGLTKRKGRNGATEAGPDDPGSPWAIGGRAGGHDAIHPELGTVKDFEALVAAAADHGIEVALDIAFQCSPDHPWIREHPQWFRHRPDGSIRHAENPPKHYQDIYPIDFETRDWRALWQELRRVIEYWVARGVHIFRVDNPHTKAFAFWEWVIRAVQRNEPRVIFLAEAFTRPKVMAELAKLGFSQSYTYFAWRQGKDELESYLRELTNPAVMAYFRANFWPNTPDILTAQLQQGGRAAFALRLLLASTLSANYGIYGPAFETLEHEPREPGSEEYRNSEKYEVRHWSFDPTLGVAPLVATLNALRREQAALQQDATLRFHHSDNPELIAYSKRPLPGDEGDRLLCIVNLDSRYAQSGWVELDAWTLGLDEKAPVELVDLLDGERYRWQPGNNFVILDPRRKPGHLFAIREGRRR